MTFEHTAISFSDENNGTIVSWDAQILRTTDGGQNWINQANGTLETLNSVSFTDANIGTAVGGVIIRTTDGGQNWIIQANLGWILKSVSFTDENNGTAVGANGYILRTTNGGQNWVTQFSGAGYQFHGVSFSDANNGTVVGDYYNGIIFENTVFRTTNGGQNWVTQSLPPTGRPTGVFFTDMNNGTIVGGWGSIVRTTDGGLNWIIQTSGTTVWLNGVSFTDVNTGTVVGREGTILRTTNGGQDWIMQYSGSTAWLNGVCFTDANNGTAVGNQGTILRTTDGGQNWINQSSGTTKYLCGVSFSDVNNGTAVGESGIILRTTNGGIPVELISLTSEVSGSEAKLNWSTATETNNSGFEIHRFTQNDNNAWEQIGFVPGHGTTTETQHYSFTDNDVKPGKYQYKLKQIDYDGTFEYSQIVEVEIPIVNKFSLYQNYPNPFNPSTSLQYAIGSRQFVTLKVYDLLGREVATLVNEEKPAGEYEVEFDGFALPSGIYFYQLKAGQYSETKKMILLK
jgi:photosystem II stability/assembly factor-like uncharacterized protein